MRHQVAGYKLNRTKGGRIALRRNLIKQFFTHERIRTTTYQGGRYSWRS